MRPAVPDVQITDSQDASLAAYRMLSGRAVVCLVFGLLSPLAMVDPMLWPIPCVGVMFGWMALRQIRKNAPEMAGRNVALAGLAVSILFLAAAPAHWQAHRRLLCKEARHFARLWFAYLAQNEPHKAYQLLKEPGERRPLDERLWDYYRSRPALREAFEGFAASPLARTLLALGTGAETRFYQSLRQWRENNAEELDLLFAVTYEENHERKSFFVQMGLTRSLMPDGGAEWRIARLRGGVKPPDWE